MAIQQVDRIVRVTWKYDLVIGGTPGDQCEHGVTFRAGSVPSSNATLLLILQDMANAALASQVAHYPTNLHAENVVATSCRVALEGTNGHTIQEKYASASGPLAWQGNGGDHSLPWQCSFAVSLYGHEPGIFEPQGKRKRGRFYLPPMQAGQLNPNESGEVSDDTALNIGTYWGTILRELQEHTYSAYPTFNPVLGINSRKTATSSFPEPDFFPVSWIRVDTKIDTQRRRTNREPANVAKAPFPPS